MTAPVYHYTDTARLPWILEVGELRPGRNRIGDFPDPDFLWATTSTIGDRTASASLDAWRQFRVRLVRIELPAELFEPWPQILDRFPAWTPQQAARLERSAAGRSDPRAWRCRAEPAPVECWLSVVTRSYINPGWRPLDRPFRIMPVGPQAWGVVIGSRVYASSRFEGPGGRTSYKPIILDAAEDAA